MGTTGRIRAKASRSKDGHSGVTVGPGVLAGAGSTREREGHLMHISWSGKGQSGRRRWRLLLVPAVGIAFVCQLSLVGTAAASVTSATTPAAPTVAPKPSNELDCNGWSPAYKAVKKL